MQSLNEVINMAYGGEINRRGESISPCSTGERFVSVVDLEEIATQTNFH